MGRHLMMMGRIGLTFSDICEGPIFSHVNGASKTFGVLTVGMTLATEMAGPEGTQNVSPRYRVRGLTLILSISFLGENMSLQVRRANGSQR